MPHMHPINFDDLNDDLEFTMSIWIKPLRFGADDYLFYYENLIHLYTEINTGKLRLDVVVGRYWTGSETSYSL